MPDFGLAVGMNTSEEQGSERLRPEVSKLETKVYRELAAWANYYLVGPIDECHRCGEYLSRTEWFDFAVSFGEPPNRKVGTRTYLEVSLCSQCVQVFHSEFLETVWNEIIDEWPVS